MPTERGRKKICVGKLLGGREGEGRVQKSEEDSFFEGIVS